MIPIVNVALQCEDPYDGTKYILVLRNAIYVPSMVNNLIPPFVMRAAVIIVSEVPKIHLDNPNVETHSMYFAEARLRMYLSLLGAFSYFPVTKPTEEAMITNE